MKTVEEKKKLVSAESVLSSQYACTLHLDRSHRKFTDDQLGMWLGNVDQLVQGVEKVSFWGSIGKR